MSLVLLALMAAPAFADVILAPGDFIIAIDTDSASGSPAAERAPNAIDRDILTKYLNSGKENSGFIVTPAFGRSVLDSFQLTTANDVEARDPTSWAVYGTNEPIASTDNSAGNAENWTLIDSGQVTLPSGRRQLGPMVAVGGNTAYKSYKMIFPTVKNTGATTQMQIAEVQFYGTSDPHFAKDPSPENESLVKPTVSGSNVYIILNYTPAPTATKHTAYFSDNYDDVLNRVPAVSLGEPPYRGVLGMETLYYVGFDDPCNIPAHAREPLVRGKTYYWVIDEFDGSTIWPGMVWSFTVMPEKAWDPNPADGETLVVGAPQANLSWKLGDTSAYSGAVSYDVYYGTDRADVEAGTSSKITGVKTEAANIGPLENETVYYWRVDTILTGGPPFFPKAVIPGDVWTFTTAPAGVGSILREWWLGIAQVSETLVSSDAQRQAHQDRSQGGQPFALCDISNGRSGCSEDTLSGNP